ncbi:E3 ubiquitin/ISG15 ligase TRIM25-like [Sinocyclocheilus rhinocerous]|uniref:E3 ubiquitin/ISG15 ligase TRIM25-like n=1 Tax=Sinocyclocheilus rhinocerous TaxID=307959 RepID=UPI0007B9AE4A|nr:PREDICTED: E3 ubiquitin/ISG15 ligase TRIM25-like [Sinocyclocheilus rhinocerous]
MAEECFEDLDPFNCPICLDALQDPVTIPCGHNYCMSCVKEYWDKNGSKYTGYSCSQCRKTFSPRPVLNKNTMFAEVVERFKNTGLQDPPPTRYDGPGHTEREICTAENSKNVKMCPESEDLCCRAHLRYRNNGYPREKHTVIVVSGEPKGNICLRHNRLLEFSCRTDQRFICPLCLNEAHQGHEAFSLAPQKTQTLECSTTLEKREHRSKDKTTGQCKRRSHGSRHRHGHRSGQTRGSHAKRGHQTHWHKSSKHRGNSHEHSHEAGHRKRRLGIMVMTGPGTRRTSADNVKAV